MRRQRVLPQSRPSTFVARYCEGQHWPIMWMSQLCGGVGDIERRSTMVAVGADSDVYIILGHSGTRPARPAPNSRLGGCRVPGSGPKPVLSWRNTRRCIVFVDGLTLPMGRAITPRSIVSCIRDVAARRRSVRRRHSRRRSVCAHERLPERSFGFRRMRKLC